MLKKNGAYQVSIHVSEFEGYYKKPFFHTLRPAEQILMQAAGNNLINSIIPASSATGIIVLARIMQHSCSACRTGRLTFNYDVDEVCAEPGG